MECGLNQAQGAQRDPATASSGPENKPGAGHGIKEMRSPEGTCQSTRGHKSAGRDHHPTPRRKDDDA